MTELVQMYILGAYRSDHDDTFYFCGLSGENGLLCSNKTEDAAHYLTLQAAEGAAKPLHAMGVNFKVVPTTNWRR
jgi:hypothetical protein